MTNDNEAWSRCPRCGEEKPSSAFYLNRRNRGRVCRTCNRARNLLRNAAQKEHVNAIKLARGCVDCGYREHAVALDFDHLPGFERYGGPKIALMVTGGRPIEEIDTEIAKCEVVCSNCHRVRTASREPGNAGWDLRRRNIAPSTAQNPHPQLRLLDDSA